jgi:hypothetical protein
LIYTYDTQASAPASLRCSKTSTGRDKVKDLQTTQSSLEDIFVSLVREDK